ncbi:uncharacterized protein LOC130766603 [Actinidia eriantha]|uniref:uncharacterized protein LOC130766603 n=1 Tax=Actinidia eriantha TaxID=165200 RepID=UPI002582A648|nr:uncharacterized protein LOC130766603 [Actinidia eriantha]
MGSTHPDSEINNQVIGFPSILVSLPVCSRFHWHFAYWFLDEVTKKNDITDFYFNLSKNVAFGAQDTETRKSVKQQKEATTAITSEEKLQLTESPSESPKLRERHQGGPSSPPEKRSESVDAKPVPHASTQEVAEQPSAEQPRRDHHKRNEDAVAAAKERFMARKRAKEQ